MTWVALWIVLGVLAALTIYMVGFEMGERRAREDLERWRLRAYALASPPTNSHPKRSIVLEMSLAELLLYGRFSGEGFPRRAPLIEWQPIKLELEEAPQ